LKHHVFTIVASLALGFGLVPDSHAIEILRWQRLPLAVPLVVGQERVVFIDRNVRVGLPPSLGERLRVQSAGGAIYLRASETIAPTRLQLQDVESGAIVLVDIAATDAREGEQPLEPVRIVLQDAAAEASKDTAAGPSQAAQPAKHRQTPVAVVLTRYAAQNLYAPLRTVEPVAGIGRVPLRRPLALDTLLPTLPLKARALAAWRLEDQWVTAVRLTNTSPHRIDLDPRALQGDFVAATFQHPDLGPAGASTDTTMVYLVTRDRGLAESLMPVLSPIDAGTNLPPAAAAGRTSDEE
jgi:integrating conjugative element protein (TIGR03749 family)